MKIKFCSGICLLLFFVSSLCFSQENRNHVSPKKRIPPSNLSAEERKITQLYNDVVEATVTIFTSTTDFNRPGARQNQGLGSGVIISKEGFILTAAHVVANSSVITVKMTDGNQQQAKVLFSDKSADIALLKLDTPSANLKFVKLGNSDHLAVGQNVYALGSPYGLEQSFSAGIISGFRGFNRLYNGTVDLEFIQTDAAINSGNSGGPLFNSLGEVIGITSSILSVSGGFQGIGMVVAINTARDLLAFEDRPWIGIESVFLSPDELSKLFNLDIGSGGLLIQRVATESPAAKAGLRGGYIQAELNGQSILLGGDIIISIANQQTCHKDCVTHAGQSIMPNSTIEIKYLREGKPYTITADVTETRRNFLEM